MEWQKPSWPWMSRHDLHDEPDTTRTIVRFTTSLQLCNDGRNGAQLFTDISGCLVSDPQLLVFSLE